MIELPAAFETLAKHLIPEVFAESECELPPANKRLSIENSRLLTSG